MDTVFAMELDMVNAKKPKWYETIGDQIEGGYWNINLIIGYFVIMTNLLFIDIVFIIIGILLATPRGSIERPENVANMATRFWASALTYNSLPWRLSFSTSFSSFVPHVGFPGIRIIADAHVRATVVVFSYCYIL